MWNQARSLLLWFPPFVIALMAGMMPDTFLDNPHSTIPHEGAFVLRFVLIVLAFAYIAVALVTRLLLRWMGLSRAEDSSPMQRTGG